MTITTLSDLTARAGQQVDNHLPTDLELPVIDGPQCQGDLLVVPLALLGDQVAETHAAAWVDVPATGVELVRGTAGGNAHTLYADPGTCRWTTDVEDTTGLAIGLLAATEPVWLLHREHGGTGIAPGRYVIRRQREQADVQRLVAD